MGGRSGTSAGRDELITELVRDAYRSLADTFRTAAESGADLPALAHTLREWALRDPQRSFLIYGTPVPGYEAPDDTTAISSEIMATLLDTVAALPPAARRPRSTPTWQRTATGRARPSTGR